MLKVSRKTGKVYCVTLQISLLYTKYVCFCRHFDNVQLSQSVKHMQKYRGKEYELKISRVKMEDKGEYVVKAENSFGRREELGILKVDRKCAFYIL